MSKQLLKRKNLVAGLLLISGLIMLLPPQLSWADKKRAENSVEARYAYTMGYRIGQMLRGQGIDKLDNDNFLKGLNDFLDGNEPRLDEVEMNDAVTSYHQHRQQEKKRDPRHNLLEGTAFLEQNSQREGVSVTASGLQYEILKSDSGPKPGPKPGPEDKVQVHYHGTLINGDVFDSSIKRGKPVEFELDGVVPGFREALTMMQVGEKWRIVLPPSLAYGARGVAGVIGPNATLIFDIELLAIEP